MERFKIPLNLEFAAVRCTAYLASHKYTTAAAQIPSFTASLLFMFAAAILDC